VTRRILLAVLATLVVAFIINLPLGFWRSGQRKYSWRCFLAIHLSIPVVVAVRVALGISLWYAPLVAVAAIGGQLWEAQAGGNGASFWLLTEGIK